MSVKLGGIISGIDSKSIIQQLIALQRRPIEDLQTKQTNLLDQSDAIGFVTSSLSSLRTKLQDLSDPVYFRAKSATSSAPNVGTALVDPNDPSVQNGSYNINITQISTQSVFRGGKASTGIFNPASAIDGAVSAGGLGADILDSTTGTAQFSITRGGTGGLNIPATFNYTINSGNSLNSVLAQINADFGAGFASYNAGTGKVVLNPASGDGSISLGTTTGSFLQKTQLFNPPNLESQFFPNGTTPSSDPDLFLNGNTKLIINNTLIDFTGVTSLSNTNDLVTRINDSATATGVRANLVLDPSTTTLGYNRYKMVLQSENGQPINITKQDGSAFTGLQSATTWYNGNNPLDISSANAIGTRDTADGVSAADVGSFTINGTSVTVNATDSLQNVLDNITGSAANVVATYDGYTDQITLTSKTAGNRSIALVNVAGNFLANFGLSSAAASLDLGKSTIYTINGGSARTSEDSTLTESELGLPGVTFTANAIGSTTLTIGADTTKIKTRIDDFVTQYNAVQNLLTSYTVIDVNNPENNGLLASDTTVNQLGSQLRSLVTGALADVSSPTLRYRVLEDLGITGNSNDNTLTSSDSTSVQNALTNNLDEIIDIFTDLTASDGYLGLYGAVNSFITSYDTINTGVLPYRQSTLNREVLGINDEIGRLEIRIAAEQAALEQSFALLESATSQSQQYTSFLQSLSSASSNKK
jgi:flagellar hook-associated protein 2